VSPGGEEPSPRRVLVLRCPDWAVTAAGHPPTDPVAVVAGPRGRVVAASAAARARGVAPGQRRRQAEGRCAGLVVVTGDPAAEARAFEPVVAVLDRFTPLVTVVAPGTAALATRGPARYFGGVEALAVAVRAAVDGAGAAPVAGPGCRVGVADGLFAAELATRVRADPEPPWGTVVEPGVVVVAPGATPAFLDPRPVAVLGMAGLADLLVRLGVRTLGQLAALPAGAVVGRFGAEGVVAHRRARGLDDRPPAAGPPLPPAAVAASLDPPAEHVEAAAFAARGLAEGLREVLAARGMTAIEVAVEVETDHGEHRSRRWRLDGDQGGTGGLVDLLAQRVRWQLEGWLAGPDRPRGAVTTLRLAAEEVVPAAGRQLGFWGGDRGEADRAAAALARVQGRWGPESVRTATVVAGTVAAGRSPAEQVQLTAWGDAGPGASLAPAPWPGRLPSPSPATVHPAPLPARVVGGDGGAVGADARARATAAPARLSVAGGPWQVVAAWAGPWPLDERWWDPVARRRRARWQVVTADGAAHLLALEGGQWAVEATYD